MNLESLSKPTTKRLIGLFVSASAITGAITFYSISQIPQHTPASIAIPIKKVTALGRLEPEAEVIRLSAPLSLDGDRVANQNATIARWQSEVRNADAEYNRFERLYQSGAIFASSLDSKRLSAETTKAQLREAIAAQNRTKETLTAQLSEAKATLSRITEVRPTDTKAAQTEVYQASAALRQAQTNLQQAYTKAPMAGRILKISYQDRRKDWRCWHC